MAKLADATDLKSVFAKAECGFKSRPGHQQNMTETVSDMLLAGRVPVGGNTEVLNGVGFFEFAAACRVLIGPARFRDAAV